MIFYVYFDGYGHLKKVVDKNELALKYGGDTDAFLNAMCERPPDAGMEHVTGHVSTLCVNSQKELDEYLASLGDEITGFYGCDSDSRPYNF